MKNRSHQLDNLLYNSSHYDDDESEELRKQLNSAQSNFIQKKLLNYDEDDDDGVDLGNGASMEGDYQNEAEDDNGEWNHQQNAKYYFRQVAGNSQQFSQSLSIHKADLVQLRGGGHDNSVNLQTININNFLNNKRKEEENVNEVINAEVSELVQKIQKQQFLIKGYKKKIELLEDTIQGLRNENEELEASNKHYHQNLTKKDELFNILRGQYSELLSGIDEKQKIQKQLKENNKSLEKQLEKLRNVLKTFSEQDKGLTDFRSLTPKRSQSIRSSFSSTREIQTMQAQIQKLKRQRKNIQTQYQLVKQQLMRKQQRYKNNEDDLKRKIAMKQKKIKELQSNLEEVKDEVQKMKKNNQSSVFTMREKVLKLEKQINMKDQKIKQGQTKVKFSIDQIKKKQEKIKQLLTQIGEKNKKFTQLKDVLQQSQARNQIDSKIQKERQNQIEKLEKQIRQLKSQNFNIRRQLQNYQKPSNLQQKLKKQLENMRKQKQSLNKELTEIKGEFKSLQKQLQAKDQKLREMKKKNEELMKKSTLSKKKSEQTQIINQENENYKQIIGKMTKEINELKKKAQVNQQMANKLYILQSRIKYSQQKNTEPVQDENQYDLQQINEALQEQLEHHKEQIQQMKQFHQRQIQRLNRQNKTLVEAITKLEEQISFKEKSLDFMHKKFLEIEKENTQLRENKNILHSSFYDDSYHEDNLTTINFYENKVNSLQKKIQNLNSLIKERDSQIKKVVGERDNFSFQINQLKNRIKDLQTMAIANQPIRKFAPQSLSHEQTIDFLVKILKRAIKSTQMIRSLAKVSDFKLIIGNLWRVLDKDPAKK